MLQFSLLHLKFWCVNSSGKEPVHTGLTPWMKPASGGLRGMGLEREVVSKKICLNQFGIVQFVLCNLLHIFLGDTGLQPAKSSFHLSVFISFLISFLNSRKTFFFFF